MKIVSNSVLDVVPNIKESDYLKCIIVSIAASKYADQNIVISYIIKNGNKFYLTGISKKNYNDETSSCLWCNEFNRAETVLQLMRNETKYCIAAEWPIPIYYFISNFEELANIIEKYNITGKFKQELCIHLGTKLEAIS